MKIRILITVYAMLLLYNVTSLRAQQTAGNERPNPQAQSNTGCCDITDKAQKEKQTYEPVAVDTTGTYFIITETLKELPALKSADSDENNQPASGQDAMQRRFSNEQ